jgi:hypothetical protein
MERLLDTVEDLHTTFNSILEQINTNRLAVFLYSAELSNSCLDFFRVLPQKSLKNNRLA